jgi:LCP family protein required for cell wall assembly
MELFGTDSDPELEELIRDFYELPEGSEATVPEKARASVGMFDEESRVAVIEAGEDVTLAVADPIWRVVGGWWPSLGIQPSLGTFPKIVAVIGSDARPGHDPLRAQADSIHFVVLDETGVASILGLPRDSWVPVPGFGNQKATSSLVKGGPEVMMQTFSDLTQLEFDGYLLTGFEGFTGLIGVLGGLDIDVPLDLNDRWAKAYIDAGRQILSAADALAFTRVRKTLRGGDFARKKNGGLALIAAAAMVEARGIGAVPLLMEQSRDLYYTDMSAEMMVLLAAAIISIDPAQITNVVAAGYVDTTSGGASIVRLEEEAYEAFEDLADGRLGN